MLDKKKHCQFKMAQISQHGKGDSLDPMKEAGNPVTILTCPWTLVPL